VVSCSICLDRVVAGGEERSTARLQCGHEFHLGERLRCPDISRSFLDCATWLGEVGCGVGRLLLEFLRWDNFGVLLVGLELGKKMEFGDGCQLR
jgi:hypothetical protein